MTQCPHCQTEYEERCPVCSGSAEEFLESSAWSDCPYRAEPRLIAARDAAKKAEGRLEGMKEAAGIVAKNKRYLSCCQQECRLADAIRAAMEEA